MVALKRASVPYLMAAALLAVMVGCALQFKPIEPKNAVTKADDEVKKDPRTVFRFFDDDFVSGGYQYTYPDASKIFIPEESGHESEVSLQFDLQADEYSGGSVCLYNLLYDLTPYVSRGALQFWVKGAKGGEIGWVALVDDENRDGKKTVVRLPLNDFGGITNEWHLVSIPLAKFGRKGVFWDPKKKVEEPNVFEWNAVAEFRIEIKKGENQAFRVWTDDIFVLRDVFEPQTETPKEDWDDKEEIIAAPPVVKTEMGKPMQYFFKDEMPAGGFKYIYGGKTAAKVQPSTTANSGVFACYFDNDYSGATIALGEGHNIDLTAGRKGRWALSFWIKASPGLTNAYVGLLDSRADGIKSQSKIVIGDFGVIDTAWHRIQIPIKRFGATGMYWDANKMAEITAEVQWDKINEVRFSINKDANKVPEGTPGTIYLDDISIVDDIPGYVDPDVYWAGFKSSTPDIVLHDFESNKEVWETAKGSKSKADFVIDANPGRKGKSISITYQLADWCDIMNDYVKNNKTTQERDWTTHWGLRFSVYTEKPFQGITVQINDVGNEIFVANVGAVRGWNDILLPFKDFSKFPYYQPPDAVQNGVFDLKGIQKVDFKPAGDGTRGNYRVDDIVLTNRRELPKAIVAANTDVKIEGNLQKTITAKINNGIFGINSALWDSDLLADQTKTYVKAVNHGILRYPGGLRADDDHWKEVLDKKDYLVDTDEFLEYCKATGTEAMFTVNFGKGTPQEAADWVEYVNKKKGAHVQLWEIGNELYGNWHPQNTTGTDYGKRTAEFIKAMKAVDPSIKVGVVWALEGEWNKEVLEATKDLADAVIVHHYPQNSGQENDQALLAAPQNLNEIIPSVQHQIKEYGTAGKAYEIWLTEWNSVDFKPGPQSLGIINALFVADYLGMLTRHNIEHADYWDIHNNLTEQGGDYGYLSRTGAPDGDNVPRASYHAFKLASESLRGKLVECQAKSADGSTETQVTCYLAEKPKGGKALLLINKYAETAGVLTLSIPGFTGKGHVKKFNAANQKTGPGEGEPIEIKDGQKLTIPARTIMTVSLD